MILFFLCISCVMTRCVVYTIEMPSSEKESFAALIFNQQTEQLDELSAKGDDKECRKCLVACPAASQREVKFNEEVSIGKKSIFVKNVDDLGEDHEYAKNIKLYDCEEPFRPSIVRDEKTNTFEIGYELYYAEYEASLRCKKFDDFLSVYNYVYKQQPEDYDSFAFKITTEDNTKFVIIGSPSLVFYWIAVLSFKFNPSPHFQIRVKFKIDTVNDDVIMSECNDYDLGRKLFRREKDVNFYYSKPTGAFEMFKKMTIPPSSVFKYKQGVGDLQRTHIMPMMFLHTKTARLATCTYLNTALVWSEIANGQLKLIDRYLYSIFRYWSPDVNIIFGVSGVQNVKIIKPQPEKESKSILHLPILPNEQKSKTEKIPVPKLIYRIVEYRMPTKNFLSYIAIIIHNDPAAVPDKDKLCSTPTIGWNAILNNDPKTGLSYACTLTKKINAVLGAYDKDDYPTGYHGVLQLSLMPPIGKIGDFVDVTKNIENMMDILFPNEQVPQKTVVNS